MKPSNKIRSGISAIAAMLLMMACSDSGSNASSEATIRGSVQPEQTQQMSRAMDSDISSQNVSGMAVMAAQVSSNGSLQTISGTETTTNASGQFTLNLDVDAAQHIVIVAEREGTEFMGHLSAQVENGQTYTLKPINATSTAGARVFTRVVASGNAAKVHKSDIEATMSAEAATRINSSATAANQFAASLNSAASARAEFLSNRISGNANQQMDAAARAMADVQFDYEAQLAAAVTAEDRDVAFESFVKGGLQAWAETGLSASQAAEATELWGRVFINAMGSASADVRNAARTQVSLVQSFALESAVDAEARAAGASNTTVQAIAEASVNLRTAIKASAGVQAEIRTAFETFRDEVSEAIENDTSIETEAFIAINTEVSSSNGLAAAFRTSVNASTNATVVNTAYTTFETAINTLTNTHISGANAEAMARLVLLLHLGA
ncbi:MAG: hypothetical protein LAT57_03900 [Balneolales bacterium]|nr:hypothetical protein [Balneolales bacterium]